MTTITIEAATQAHFKILCESRKDAAKQQLEEYGLRNASVTLDYQQSHAILLVERKPQIKYNFKQTTSDVKS